MESMNESRSIRVIIADDQELVRAGFAMVIGSQPDMEVVGQASDGAQAVALAESLHPDVVLMDDKPSNISRAIRVARKTMAIVWQNIIFALGVKLLILVLAALGIANMWLAVFGDVGVAIIAILNAMRAMGVKNL